MRISDWSSDVCSSDLAGASLGNANGTVLGRFVRQQERKHIAPQVGLNGGLPCRITHSHHLTHRSRVQIGLVEDEQRSEEPTSELQSLMRISYAVFCLKKKKNNTKLHTLNNITHYAFSYKTQTSKKSIINSNLYTT